MRQHLPGKSGRNGFAARANGDSLHRNGSAPDRTDGPVLITGGAGFIGTNLARRLLDAGQAVLLFDNLSRPGVERNLAWLREHYGTQVSFLRGDTRDRSAVREAVRHAVQVFHFAAQVAVTTSLVHPVEDFEINVGGTLNVLEEIRALPTPPPLVYTSTNKVYGALDRMRLRRTGNRYEPAKDSAYAAGVDESCPLDFHSPYGCSKGAADQYVLDYARSFGLKTAVFRMSCIYGPHQFGTEDQGWVAHFLIRALENQFITIYGDGRQVRDLLFVEDLAEAFVLAQRHMDKISGQAFNIGGGPENTISLLELLELIADLEGEPPLTETADWRTGDQRYYVSNTTKFQHATGWEQKVGVRAGVSRLHDWLLESRTPSLPQPVLAGGDGR